MNTIINIGVSAMRAAEARVAASASSQDLADLKMAKLAFKASAFIIRQSDEIAKTTLDIFA